MTEVLPELAPRREQRPLQREAAASPAAAFPTYSAFELAHGLTLGPWSTKAADFVSSGTCHRSEIAFMLTDDASVERRFDEWTSMCVTIEQAPFTAVFGRTFVALDPDGHRLRCVHARSLKGGDDRHVQCGLPYQLC